MSRKRKKPKISNTKLEVGKFYNVHDGSFNGHPGRIEFADLNSDTYISVTTRSETEEEFKKEKYRKDYKVLSTTTSKDVYKSLVHRRPFIGSILDYGKEYPMLKIDSKDEKIIEEVMNKNPRFGYWYKHKNKKPS